MQGHFLSKYSSYCNNAIVPLFPFHHESINGSFEKTPHVPGWSKAVDISLANAIIMNPTSWGLISLHWRTADNYNTHRKSPFGELSNASMDHMPCISWNQNCEPLQCGFLVLYDSHLILRHCRWMRIRDIMHHTLQESKDIILQGSTVILAVLI